MCTTRELKRVLERPGAAPRCDVCEHDSWTKVLEAEDRYFGIPGRFSVLRCRRCGVGRTDPQPDDVERFYPRDRYYSFIPPRAPSRLTQARVRAAYGLEPVSVTAGVLGMVGTRRLTPGLPPGPPGDLLDIGCGSGQTLLALERAGWRCSGVELDGAAVAAARSAGLVRVQHGDLLDLAYPSASFDVVRFWHSLEHLRSPSAQLDEARRVLRSRGRLLVGVPNFASLLSRLSGNRWFYLDVPRHLWHFTPASLRRLVTEAGFDVTDVRYVSTATPLLGTLGFCFTRVRGLERRRGSWFAALPLAALLDGLRVGDALELRATARP